MLEYTGFIKKVRYYSESSHYIVAVIEVEEEDNDLVMNGYMSQFNDYDKYIFYGDFQIHPKYGNQFKMDHYEVVLSQDRDEMIKYLSSPLFKGVGKVLAGHIVDALGKDTFELIKEDKHHLDLIKGMTEAKRDLIYDVLTSQDFDQEVVQFFMGHGISMRHLGLIQATYKEKTLQVLQNTPYRIIDDIDGIGFKTADELALKIGFSADEPERMKAGIIYSIKQLCFQSGSTFVYYDEMKKAFFKIIFNIDDETFDSYLSCLIEDRRIVLEENRYYESNLYDGECFIAQYIQQLSQLPKENYDQNMVESMLKQFESEKGIVYSKRQKEVIDYFLKYPVTILTGGPGTGKTTIVNAVLKIYKQLYPEEKIDLLAPTGRAAKRLTELTGIEASTIHRKLKWDLHSNVFAVNEKNPLDSDIIIIDEFSMVDCLLLSHLFKASGKCHKLLLIGDHHQLPSVSPGRILKDMIDSQAIHIIELDEIYRQSRDSGIITLAHDIIHQQMTMSVFERYKDISFFQCANTEVIKNVVMIVKKAISEGYTMNDIQVLAPMYQGIAGIDNLNLALQEVFNPSCGQDEYRIGRKVFRVQDKILQLKNRPEDDVYNGDIGILTAICLKDGFEFLQDTLIVDFDGRLVEYTPQDFFTITHAYCMSIHKSQGNEFKIVIMTVLNDYHIMLKRNLIYTGLTRAKRSLFILGSQQALLYGISNFHDERRKTTLALRLQQNKELSVYDFLDDGDN